MKDGLLGYTKNFNSAKLVPTWRPSRFSDTPLKRCHNSAWYNRASTWPGDHGPHALRIERLGALVCACAHWP